MLIYDKIIVDASNFFYRVAALYLKDLTLEAATTLMKNNTVFSQYKSVIKNLKVQTLGEIKLLFDPMLSNGNMSTRLKLKEGYKINRDKNTPVAQLKRDTLEKLYSDFIVDPQPRIDVYHDVSYEADDFAEKLTEEGKCLLVTSDEDFTRYLEKDRVEMLIHGLSINEENIFTAEDFEKKYGFKPTIASVTFWKALVHGDVSDNIVSVFKNPNTKIIRTAVEEMEQIIKELGEGLMSLEEAKTQYFSGVGRFERFAGLLRLSNTDRSYEKFLDLSEANFQVIESFLPRNSSVDIDKFKIKLDLKVNQANKKKKFSLNRKI